MFGTHMIFPFSFPPLGPAAERVVPKTVVEGWEAYAFAREAPRPRVAPMIRTLVIVGVGN